MPIALADESCQLRAAVGVVLSILQRPALSLLQQVCDALAGDGFHLLRAATATTRRHDARVAGFLITTGCAGVLGDLLHWDSAWELYFHFLIFIPIIQRLILLGEPALMAVRLHGHHLKWLFERLREIPRGYTIAVKFTIGLLVPTTIALMRFFVPSPDSSGYVELAGVTLHVPAWSDMPDWHYLAIGAFFIAHSYLDFRRVWDTRELAIRIISIDISLYRPMVDRMLSMGDWLHGRAERGVEAQPHERVARFAGYLAGRVIDTTNSVVDKVMEKPDAYARRWMLVNIGIGLAFHLLPLVFLFLLVVMQGY